MRNRVFCRLIFENNEDGGYRRDGILLKTDGGARGNPGLAGAGAVVYY